MEGEKETPTFTAQRAREALNRERIGTAKGVGEGEVKGQGRPGGSTGAH